MHLSLRFCRLTTSDPSGRGSVSILSIWWMWIVAFGTLVIGATGRRLLDAQRIQTSADAVALALATGDSVGLSRLSAVLNVRITRQTIVGHVVTVEVKTPWGTGSASASTGAVFGG